MRLQYFLSCLLLFLLSFVSLAQDLHGPTPPPLEGRWDLIININGKPAPGWLEVRHSGLSTLVGRIMLINGSARPISKVNFADGNFDFSIPPQWTNGDNALIKGKIDGDSLRGTVTLAPNKVLGWVGGRAPSMRDTKVITWAKPINLFNDKNLEGWQALGKNQWVVENGVLKSPQTGANLVTDKKFTDFKLHIEFRYAQGSNSGVYLRGRYEVQITDAKGLVPWDDQFSGIYGLLEPNEMVAKEAGEWQSFDITLIGRRVSIIANGVAVITDEVIPGITGEALDSYEGEPGPILLQGNHGPIEFRNIIITPSK